MNAKQCKLVKTFAKSANDLKFLISLFRVSLSLHISSQTKPLFLSLCVCLCLSFSPHSLSHGGSIVFFGDFCGDIGVGLVVCLQGQRGSDSLVVFLKHELKYSFILQRFLKPKKVSFFRSGGCYFSFV